MIFANSVVYITVLSIGSQTQILFLLDIFTSLGNSEKMEKQPVLDQAGDSEDFFSELNLLDNGFNGQQ